MVDRRPILEEPANAMEPDAMLHMIMVLVHRQGGSVKIPRTDLLKFNPHAHRLVTRTGMFGEVLIEVKSK